MNIIVIFFFVIIGVLLYLLQTSSHKKRIHEQIEAIGGKVINIERRTFSTGPFFMPGKGRTVYRIEYTANGQEKEGWVKFGNLSGPDWRL